MYALLVPAAASASASASAGCGGRRRHLLSRYPAVSKSSTCRLLHHDHHHRCLVRVGMNNNEYSGSEMLCKEGGVDDLEEEANKIVDGLDFGELCNEFECKSSPSVESTARQLLRDILELRQGNRALGIYAPFVNYKDPLRSFTGRDKYKRPLWITGALHNPSVSVQEMAMLSSSMLRIRWTIKGKPKSSIVAAAAAGGGLLIRVDSEFRLNQISGQVIEHRESWDLSGSSTLGKTFFWGSRRLYAVLEGAKDLSHDLTTRFNHQNQNNNSTQDIFQDPTGDPTRFFQRDNSFQQDVYQIALFLALVYFVVQLLRSTL